MTYPTRIGPDTMVHLKAASWSEMAILLNQMRDLGMLARGIPKGSEWISSDDIPEPRALVRVPVRSLFPKVKRKAR